MITYSEFIKKYLGKGTDADGAAGVQCVDLIKLYLKECFGIKAGSWGDARYYFESFHKSSWGGYYYMNKYFSLIENDPDLVPMKGDICVFGAGVGGGHGHISIATGEGNTRTFYSYDQNWNGKPMKKVKHKYNSEDFLGVLRPRFGVIRTSANVRAGAGTSYRVVDEIPAGTLVEKKQILGTWVLTDKGGWVAGSLID